ncbi:hypothetical protein [Sediminitomix flava]|uniref:Uncharacterized protein n=1 Tax=Sediminitomix flava TaxID=379075 RepID=A0A315Z9V8_SEDFL|nr:hypothetical protein [Sediminitomix flava]PWJ42356.1 hypothetical protein BC781_103608 [Sediminitomix flava]
MKAIQKTNVLLLFLIVLSSKVIAQDVVKNQRANQYWLNTDLDYNIDDLQTLKYQGQYRSVESLSGERNLRWHQRLGYAYKLTNHWELEGAVRYVVDQNLDQNEWYFQGLLKHIGKIGSVDFEKFISYEQVKFTNYENRGAGTVVDNFGRFSVSALLGKDFKIKELPLRVEFDYIFFKNLGDAKHDDARLIDRGRLSFSVLASLTESLQAGLFVTRQVDYSPLFLGGTYPQQDEDGNLILDDNGNIVMIEQADYYVNDASTLIGCKLLYTINRRD